MEKSNKRQEKRLKEFYKRPKPKQWQLGDIKEEIKFALFPKNIDNENVVWLEKYIETYEFKEKKYRIEVPLEGICSEVVD